MTFPMSRHKESMVYSSFECYFCKKTNWVNCTESTNEAVADIEAMKCWNCKKASFIVESDLVEMGGDSDPAESPGLKNGIEKWYNLQ